jgi:hypothetical protein
MQVGCYLYLFPEDGNVRDIWETKLCEMTNHAVFGDKNSGQK